MIRAVAIVTLLLASAADVPCQDGGFTPLFEAWRTDGPVSQIAWKFRTFPATLSPHQRLVQRFEVEVDAAEIQKRRGRGVVFLLEVEDPSGRRARIREVIDLTEIPADGKVAAMTWRQDAFVLPGVYKVSVAVDDPSVKEHSFLTREVKVQLRQSDPLPAMWKDLPAVEFLPRHEQTDSWFQPYMRGKLNLPVLSRRPIQIEIVMNTTLSETVQDSPGAFLWNMSLLVPALRVLSEMSVQNGSLNVTVLDLVSRKKWEQKDVRSGLDWRRMREPFASKTPGVIDAQSLAGKAQMRQFFWESVLDKLRMPAQKSGSRPLRVVIVLSSPVFLERQYKVEPPGFPKDPNARVYYLRYRPLQPDPPMVPGGALGVPSVSEVIAVPPPPAMSLPSDDLENTLKLLDAKVFSLVSAEQFRRALATILSDVGRM